MKTKVGNLLDKQIFGIKVIYNYKLKRKEYSRRLIELAKI